MTTLTLGYAALEDRLQLLVRQAQQEQVLWLTRRLTQGLLELLARLVQQSIKAPALPPGQSADLVAAWQEDWLALQHVRAVAQVREAQRDQPLSAASQAATQEQQEHGSTAATDSAASAADATDAPDPSGDLMRSTHLLTRVDASLEAQHNGLHLTLFAGEDDICRLLLPSAELHWLLERLMHLSREAGWQTTPALPAWLDQAQKDLDPTTAQAARSTHRLH